MKKTTVRISIIAFIALLMSGSLWAQDCSRADFAHGAKRASGKRVNLATAEPVTVNGKLQLVDGRIAVVSDGKTYYANGPVKNLIGFVDGLNEGAAVKLEGPATAVPLNANAHFLWVTKLTFNGKTYDFPVNAKGYWQ